MYRGHEEEGAREKWGKLVAQLQEENRTLKLRRDEAEARAAKLTQEAEQGRAFKKMLAFVQQNDMARVAWERFLMTLKMVDSDAGN